jgi:NAD(P)-dependent dehydrogenase (short-subunit alcohol dehydrogenase family)
VIVATRTLRYGEEAVAAIRESGGEATAIECDIARRDQVFRMVERAVQTYGTVDLLVTMPPCFHAPGSRR